MAISLSFLTSPPFRWSGGRLSFSIPNAVGDDLTISSFLDEMKYHYRHLRFDALIIISQKQFHPKVQIRSVTSIPRQRVELVVAYKRADGHQIGKTEIQAQRNTGTQKLVKYFRPRGIYVSTPGGNQSYKKSFLKPKRIFG